MVLGRGLLGPVQVSSPQLWVLTGLSWSLSARPLSGVGERPCPVSPEAGPGLGAAQSSAALQFRWHDSTLWIPDPEALTWLPRVGQAWWPWLRVS